MLRMHHDEVPVEEKEVEKECLVQEELSTTSVEEVGGVVDL